MIKFLKSKRLWLLTGLGFLVLLAFLDRNNFMARAKLRQQIHKLENERDHYQSKITEDSIMIERLKNDFYLEKYARENYLLRRDNDEVFIIK